MTHLLFSRLYHLALATFCLLLLQCSTPQKPLIELEKGTRVVLIGNNLCSRMMNFGHFEALFQLNNPDNSVVIRNMCDGGNTPGFRPHSGRNSPWAFEGAENFQSELANPSGSIGHFETPDEWLGRLQADVILAFFGYNESFAGPEGVELFEQELEAFIQHTKNQKYNGKSAPQLVLISSVMFEDLSATMDVPDGVSENQNLSLYTDVMQKVAAEHGIAFINAFEASGQWMKEEQPLTIDGSQLNAYGYKQLSSFLISQLLGQSGTDFQYEQKVREAVLEKNWYWHNDYKIPNGVHVFGRRYDPFGPDNYPYELQKVRQMTAIRDSAIWSALNGQEMDLKAADRKTIMLPKVKTNYSQDYGHGDKRYLYGEEALKSLQVPPGYKIELFASETEFPDLANPAQLSFDNKGRLWVACMPSYPHYKPGDPRPNDKLIILEDTDGNGQADKQTVFADGLHLPIGFELAPEGVYVSQGTNLKLFTDTDGDDRADTEQIILSGFDDHDTHHAISAFSADPSGAIYMGEGVFLHTNVETSYGPVRGTNGGFYRYSPQRRKLERTAQLSIPNPWGIAFDTWGQNFFLETSGPALRWMLPGTVKPRYGEATPKSTQLIEEAHLVRPTSGLEFVSSRHFPDEVQGDLLLGNTIGFLGIKQHHIEDKGTGYATRHRQDLVIGEDKNFRPVDLEFAPDGSLYFIDWHNVLIGHMQHNARDPYRDHVHGRVYRITYPSRPLITPAKIDGASIPELLDNLRLPEYRTRYRTRRELRGRAPDAVLQDLSAWMSELDPADPKYDQYLLEALWVTWGLNEVDEKLIGKLLNSEDYRIRAAATRVLRYTGHQVAQQRELLNKAAQDEHGRVRLEAIVSASWLDAPTGLQLLEVAAKKPLDEWMISSFQTAKAHLKGENLPNQKSKKDENPLAEEAAELWEDGHEIFRKDGYCGTCHQMNGNGLPNSGFPPLANSQWVRGNKDRLVKLTLKGLTGPIRVLDQDYPGQVPMTAFEGLLEDYEVAAVLTYIRNAFGNNAPPVYPDEVTKIRTALKDREGYYTAEELLEQHPFPDEVN